MLAVVVAMLAVIIMPLTVIVTPTTVIDTMLAVIVTMIAVIDTMTTVKMAGIAKTLKIAVFALFPVVGGQKATVVTRLRLIC